MRQIKLKIKYMYVEVQDVVFTESYIKPAIWKEFTSGFWYLLNLEQFDIIN